MAALISPRPHLYSADELQHLTGHARYELIRGELYRMPNNNAEHGALTFDFSLEIGLFVRQNNLGRCFAAETRFTIEKNPDTSLGPDFAFVSKEHLPTSIPPRYLELAPDLVLETISPNDKRREVALKVARWLAAGVRLVWVLDPKRQTLTVHRENSSPQTLGDGDILTGEEVLPGFTMPVSRIFRREAE